MEGGEVEKTDRGREEGKEIEVGDKAGAREETAAGIDQMAFVITGVNDRACESGGVELRWACRSRNTSSSVR